MKCSERIAVFTEEIWQWFAEHKRALPWRDMELSDTDERAYRVLVSEVMLQQTQVDRVKNVFKSFLERYPNVSHLADASNGEVLMAWRGMGYNGRALRLRDAARCVVSEHSGVFPRKMKALQALPGVGHYTAAAVRNFAFLLETPCIDTNIRRILHRVFFGPERLDGTFLRGDAELLDLAGEVLEAALASEERGNRTTADWHAALMDFGSLVCTKRRPQWELWPERLLSVCKAAYKVQLQQGGTAKKEPGRMVASRFVPNRIFRGKIVEELRDAEAGLTLCALGKRVCIDWEAEHQVWLRGLLAKLESEQLLTRKGSRYRLAA